MVNGVDEEGEAHDIGKEDEFLSCGLADFEHLMEACQCSGRVGERLTCRTSVHICPTCVRNCMPAIHSSKLNRVSRAKSWRWDTRRSITYFRRGSEHCELMRWTFSVMFSIVRFLSSGTEGAPEPAMMCVLRGNYELGLVEMMLQVSKEQERGRSVSRGVELHKRWWS